MLRLLAPAVLLGVLASTAAVEAGETARVYRVRQTVTLDQIEPGAKQVRWWISIPDDERHQDVLDFAVTSAPGEWRVAHDVDRANRFLYVEVDEPAEKLEVVVDFTLRRQPVFVEVDPARVRPLTDDHRALLAEHLRRDAPHMEVTQPIARMADEVCGDERNPAVVARLLLQHVADVADHYSKDPSKPNCGIGDAGVCLDEGGGCCTDLHSLFIALARARELPARLQMGYRVLQKNLGKEVDPGYRCWVEYFLPGCGWVPADIVEADALDGLGPERWFTGLTEQRLWLNEGRQFTFEPRQAGGPVNTMIIGHAEIDGRPARVLPDGDLLPQLHRKVLAVEVPVGESAALASAATAGATRAR